MRKQEKTVSSAVLLIGHGSRDPEGNQEFWQLVTRFQATTPFPIVEGSFLEFARPTIRDGIACCVARGAETITVVPGMLLAAGHVKRDIPREVQEAHRSYPAITFSLGKHLYPHPKLIELCQVRIEEASGGGENRKDTLLLVVSRGSRHPGAQADMQELTHLLGTRMGFGQAIACYLGVASPRLPEALTWGIGLGYPRILVFPFLLFTGVLEKRVRQVVATFAGQHAHVEFLLAPYLYGHPLLIEALQERVDEAG
ncbi:MAG: sirohydrochlorin chelatase [Nitrospinota bacterium]|nr:MAG: sirohydrochlorin chelatase [Nitrospinota bacterium]